MKTKAPEEREADHQKVVRESYELCDQFIVESVNIFAEESQIYDTIRSLRKMKSQWMNLESGNNQESKRRMLEDVSNIESLLLDISEGRSRCTEAICNSYEHAED